MMILCVTAFQACSHSVGRSSAPPETVGVFSYGEFDLELRLYLNQDGTYRETRVGPLTVLLPDGSLPPEPVREKGRFSVRGASILLVPDKGRDRELRFFTAGPIRLEEKSRGTTHVYLKVKKEASQLPKPTSGLAPGRGSS